MTRTSWSLCFIATVGLIGLCLAEHAIERSREIILQSGSINTKEALNFYSDTEHLGRVRRYANDVEHQYLVHVARALTEEEKKSIEDHVGTNFGAYIPHNTFLLVADQQAAARAAGHSLVQWVGDYAPQHKLSKSLNDKSDKVVVTLAPKQRSLEDAQRIAASWQGSLNGQAVAVSENMIQVTSADTRDVSWISEQPESHFIEPAVNYVPLNFYAAQEIQSHAIATPLFTAGLDGSGVVVGLADSGIRTTSCYFTNGSSTPSNTLNPNAYKIVRYISTNGDTSDASGHGTAVAGTIAGQSSSTGGMYDGLAPRAKIHFTDLQSGTGALNVPADIKTLFTAPMADGVSLFVTPFGSANSASWYGTDAQSIDSYMFANPNFLVIASAGNNQSLSSLALSKNALVVGSSMNSVQGIINQQPPAFVNQVQSYPALYGPHVLSSFSARGPTPDGRIKPDVVTVGESLYTASNAGDCNLVSVKGTSYAAGAAGAAAAIVQQYFNQSWYPSGFPDPSSGTFRTPPASLVKAMLIHSGQPLTLTDVTGSGMYQPLAQYPSAYQGFGRIQLDQALLANAYTPSNQALFIRSAPLATGQSLRYCFQTVTSDAQLKATLVWTDRDATPASGHVLVNDLDLAIITQDGTTFRTNTAEGQFDSFNNVEQVRLMNLPSTSYFAVYVHGRNVPVGPQSFSLVITGNIAFADCIGDFDDPVGNRTCPNSCSRQGTCNNDGYCVCSNGRTGMDCSLIPCPANSNGVVCNGNGYCDFTTSTCVCGLNFDPTNNCLTEIPPPVVSNTTNVLSTGGNYNGPYTVGLLAGTIIAAFIVGAVCSIFLGGFIAVKYLEHRRDKIQKAREDQDAEMH